MMSLNVYRPKYMINLIKFTQNIFQKKFFFVKASSELQQEWLQLKQELQQLQWLCNKKKKLHVFKNCVFAKLSLKQKTNKQIVEYLLKLNLKKKKNFKFLKFIVYIANCLANIFHKLVQHLAKVIDEAEWTFRNIYYKLFLYRYYLSLL